MEDRKQEAPERPRPEELLQLRIARMRRRGSPRTMGAQELDLYVLALPDGDYIPILGAARGPAGQGPASFREPGSAVLRLGEALLLWRLL
jgi:hypothetical protein